MGETNLEKLNRLASQRYDDGENGLHQFSNDFCVLRANLECLNSLMKDKDSLKKLADSLYENEKISNDEYQKLIALVNGIEVAL